MANYRVELPGYYSSVELKPISEIFQQSAQSGKARQELLGRSAGYLFHSIIDALTDDLLNLVRKIVGNIGDHTFRRQSRVIQSASDNRNTDNA
jgi:hypothetical protein